MEEITIIIKTFERKKSLWRLLFSIKKYYPNAEIIVLDDSRNNYKTETLNMFRTLKIKYIVENFDIGLSKGRNILLSHVETEFFLLCDDDYEFDERTNLSIPLRIIKNNNLSLVGGAVYNIFRIDSFFSFLWALKKPKRFFDIYNNKEITSIYNGEFFIERNSIKLFIDSKSSNFSSKDFYNSEIVSNFFLARTSEIKKINGWQPEIAKVGEHQPFFLKMKINNLKVAYSPLFGVKHYPKKTIYYSLYRMRSFRMLKESLFQLGIKSYFVIDKNTGNEIFSYKMQDYKK